MGGRDFKKGDHVEVTNCEDIHNPELEWDQADFFGYDDSGPYPYLVKRRFVEYVDAWRHCRHAEHGRYNFRVNDMVFVSDSPGGPWIRRHFAGWHPDGNIQCWPDGMTSFTVYPGTIKPETWKYYTPYIR